MAAPWEKYRAGGQTVGTADPRIPLAMENTQAQTGRTVTQTRGDQIDNATKAQTSPYVVQKARADALAAEKTARGLTPELQQQAQGKLSALANLEDVLTDLEGQYARNFKGQPLTRGFGLTELVPGKVTIPFTGFSLPISPTNNKFNSTGLRAGPFIQSILGLGSKEADAAAEYERKVLPFIPQANDDDTTIASKLGQMRRFLERQRAGTQKQLGIKASPMPAPKKQSRVIDFNDLP